MQYHDEKILASLWKTPFGQRVYDWELRTLHRMADPLLGLTALEIGYPFNIFSKKSVSGCLFRKNTENTENTENRENTNNDNVVCFSRKELFYLYFDPTALPFQSRSIDMISACHVLDTHESPEDILRDLYRVLSPDGVLMLSLFNPHSWVRWASWFNHELASDWKRINASRLRDWLKVLGFNVEQACFGVYMPPYEEKSWFFSNKRLAILERFDLMGERWWPAMGAVLVISAKKQTLGSSLVGRLSPSRSFQAKPILVSS